MHSRARPTKKATFDDKTTADIREIPVFASMWNMDGLILMGFCEADYEALRSQTRISFVVYDGYFAACSKVVNLTIGHYDGGYQAGQYARELGHTKALCLADNDLCMDKERMDGFRAAFAPGKALFWQIPALQKERSAYYAEHFHRFLNLHSTVVFAASDFYALDFMRFLQTKGVRIPDDVQIIGFDDNRRQPGERSHPDHRASDAAQRAKTALACLEAMRSGKECEAQIVLPVTLIPRESTRKMPCRTL